MSNGVVRIKGRLHCKVWQSESGVWVGVCDAPRMTMQADTWAEMMEAIHEGLEMALQDFIETGDFQQFLDEQGWEIERPFEVGTETEFDLPFVPELVEAQ